MYIRSNLLTRKKQANKQHSGFTLLEIMVVVLIIGVILAMISLTVSPNPRTKLRDEATRLATVMQTAQEEAILQGKLFAMNIGENGYAFYEYGLGGMEEITGDEILKPHKLPENIRITEAVVDGPKDDKKIWILLYPTGELTAFGITFSDQDYHWSVQGDPGGNIEPVVELKTRS